MLELGNVFILGDSYSTFKGYVPDGYFCHYSNEGRPDTDVNDVSQTWWKRVLNSTNSNLVLNSSFSGTTICHTGYNGEDCSYKSFIARLDKLIDEDFFGQNKIDTFLVFGGTNDFWAKAPIGEAKYSDWTREELFSVLPAFGYLLDRIIKNIPEARLLCIFNEGLGTLPEKLSEMCDKLGVQYIRIVTTEKCGHPNVLGMKEISEQVLAALEK